MLVQWCLRGVRSSASVPRFGDAEATATMNTLGIRSAWVWDPSTSATGRFSREDVFADAHAALSPTALDDHVNNFGAVKRTTPYLSLTAGVVTWGGSGVATPHGAWTTAANFATGGGQVEGYIFECWVLVGPKPVPELPGFGEEVRDLNASAQFSIWHFEGEIAAKLVVPPRQIRRVVKIDAQGMPVQEPAPQPRHAGETIDWQRPNPDFVEPHRITNLRDLVP
ncbi:hypothetical protein [Neoroseomonas lacus]|uniref:Uncharacterized protein n=1 Tax=Neoroseomonas lacus TaxID=287609 RepID=A0A917NHB7_9PROT|nr:hypothetical protein [Neoroseomonas lacus]GGJ00584.1 hypothetical protein GCM10011320_04270 [Neoroseomonas lacus]